MKFYLYILFTLFTFNSTLLLGQSGNVQTENRTFSDEQWQKVTKAVDYHSAQKRKTSEQEIKKIGYEDQIEKSDFKKEKEQTIPHNNFDLSGLRFVGIALLILIGSFLIYFFIKNSNWKSDKKIEDLHSVLAEIEENLPEADVETPLERAKKEQNFKVATRLYYLLLLQKLSERKYIKWSKEKTNRNYITEIRGQDFLEHFKQVTNLYERAWFGKENVNQEQFDNIEPFFTNLIQKIS